jgi:hypothetical protein
MGYPWVWVGAWRLHRHPMARSDVGSQCVRNVQTSNTIVLVVINFLHYFCFPYRVLQKIVNLLFLCFNISVLRKE